MVALRALAQSLERVRIPPHQVIVEAARCNCKGYEAVASSAITRATIAPPASIIRIQQGAFSTKAPAKKGKKDKDEGGGGGGGGTAGPPIGDVKTVAPVNIHKDGKDPPLLPDDQYPEWLFNLRPLTLPEYRKIDISKLPLKEQRRYWKLLNRQVIKEKNAAGQKL